MCLRGCLVAFLRLVFEGSWPFHVAPLLDLKIKVNTAEPCNLPPCRRPVVSKSNQVDVISGNYNHNSQEIFNLWKCNVWINFHKKGDLSQSLTWEHIHSCQLESIQTYHHLELNLVVFDCCSISKASRVRKNYSCRCISGSLCVFRVWLQAG